MTAQECKLCLKKSLITLIDFGSNPRCIDYKANNSKIKQDFFNFALGQCNVCGTLQLVKTIPEKYLLSKYNWIKNNEPDDHADILAKIVLECIEGNNSRVLFVSKYDKRVFDLVEACIGNRAYLLDPHSDLDIDKVNFSQATIQDKVNPLASRKLVDKLGKFDLIVTCRMLEHAQNTNKFISSLTKLLNQNGRLIIEVPDSTKSLLQGDIAMLWEEHCNYFTPESLRTSLQYLGYRLNKYIGCYYPQEDALIAVFQHENNNQIKEHNVGSTVPTGEIAIGNIFVGKIRQLQVSIFENLKNLKNEYGKIVVFGAGHRAIMFINLLKIQDYILCVIDDDQNKNGLMIPGTSLEIRESNFLQSRDDIGVCLLAIGVNAERNIIKILNKKSKSPMKFFSISSDSRLSIYSKIFEQEQVRSVFQVQ